MATGHPLQSRGRGCRGRGGDTPTHHNPALFLSLLTMTALKTLVCVCLAGARLASANIRFNEVWSKEQERAAGAQSGGAQSVPSPSRLAKAFGKVPDNVFFRNVREAFRK